MHWPEVDFKILEKAKFGPLLAQKRQNWGKFFYLQTPKKGVYWPFLALILGTPSQALKIITVLGCLERVYQVSRPGKANQSLFWAFSVKRMILYVRHIQWKLRWHDLSGYPKSFHHFSMVRYLGVVPMTRPQLWAELLKIFFVKKLVKMLKRNLPNN